MRARNAEGRGAREAGEQQGKNAWRREGDSRARDKLAHEAGEQGGGKAWRRRTAGREGKARTSGAPNGETRRRCGKAHAARQQECAMGFPPARELAIARAIFGQLKRSLPARVSVRAIPSTMSAPMSRPRTCERGTSRSSWTPTTSSRPPHA